VASALGRHAALPAEKEGQRQATSAEQSRGQPTHTRPHPRRQPCSPCHPLHGAAASGARRHGQGTESALVAALRQGGAARARQTKQEENSRGE
jgi:hypothetical protein